MVSDPSEVPDLPDSGPADEVVSSPARRFPWPRWAQCLVAAAVIITLTVPLFIWREPIRATFAEPERVTEMIRSHGAWGPTILIGLYVAQTVAAPIPGQALNFAAGYIFGLPVGLSFIGAAWQEAALIQLAYAFEQVSKVRVPPQFLTTANLTPDQPPCHKK